MSVTLQVKVNGGAPQTGGVDVSDGDTIQLTAASKAGWAGSPPPRWELSDFPPGFACPAGWSTDGSSGAYYYAGTADPPSFAVNGWGKYMLTLTATDAGSSVSDVSTAIRCLSPLGLRSVGRGEGAQFGGERRRWVAELDADLRTIEDAVTGGGTVVQPSGDATGVTDADAIQAVLDADEELVLVAGATYVLDRALTIPSGARIRTTVPGVSAKLTRASSWAPAVGLADDSTNSVLKIRGAASGTVNTTLSATAQMGKDSITVASATGISAGTWLLISGSNAADPYYGQMDNITYSSIAQVASSYVSGTTIPLASRLYMHHATGVSVTSITPINDVDIRDVELDFSGATSTPVAVGVEGYLARNVRLLRVAAHGFSRACFDWLVCERIQEIDVSSRGQANCLTLRRRSFMVETRGFRWVGELGREHPQGIPAPVINDKMANVSCYAGNGTIIKANALWRIFGGLASTCENVIASDLYSAEMQARDPDISTQGNVHGIVFEGSGRIVPTWASFGYGNAMRNITVSNAFQSTLSGGWWLYLHDQHEGQLSNILIQNKGNGPNQAGSYARGMTCSDYDAVITNVVLDGCCWAAQFENTAAYPTIDGFYATGRSGDGNYGDYALLMRYSGGSGLGPKILAMRLTNFYPPFLYFDSAFTAAPDRSAFIKDLWIDSLHYSDVYPASIDFACSPGSVGEWSAAGSPADVVAVSSASKRAVVAIEQRSNNWTWVATGDACPIVSGATPARGDIMVSGGTNQAVVNNAPADPLTAAWRVIVPATAGNQARCRRMVG